MGLSAGGGAYGVCSDKPDMGIIAGNVFACSQEPAMTDTADDSQRQIDHSIGEVAAAAAIAARHAKQPGQEF
jgi:hypothetical protein